MCASRPNQQHDILSGIRGHEPQGAREKLMTQAKNQRVLAEHFERSATASDRLGRDMDTAILGLVGEVGSLVSALKKKRRDTDGFLGYHDAVLEELGDVLWYVSAVARRGGTSLSDVLARATNPMQATSSVTLGSLAQAKGFDEVAVERALLELAGEAGDLAKRFIGSAYRDNVDALRGDLVRLLRPLGRAAAAAEVSLDQAGQKNIAKTQDRWPTEQKFPPLFDEGLHIDEQLPRLFQVEIYEREVNGKKFVFQKSGGILLGDRLTDNHVPEDDYRFHDVFHLAYAAVLGWSPTTRALLKIKRKSLPRIDENEDGARAVLIEEGLATWIFETAKRHQFFANTPQLGLDLLKAVKNFVRGYEAEQLPLWLWERAILQGYAVFRELRLHRRGIVTADLAKRQISFGRWPAE
jgi:NTP pyrophosphatase (non-canonical NTP hydrolase)